MSKNLIIALALLFTCSCNHNRNEETAAHTTTQKQEAIASKPARNKQVQDWVDKNINVFYLEERKERLEWNKEHNFKDTDVMREYTLLPDTVYIQWLNATIYHVDVKGASDAPEYYLMHNKSKNLFYIYEYNPWGDIYNHTFNTAELYKYFLNNYHLRPYDPAYSGLENFLNNCDSLHKSVLKKEQLDVILQKLIKPGKLLSTPDEIDELVNSTIESLRRNKNPVDRVLWKKIKSALIARLSDKSTLIYSSGFYVDYTPGAYFERAGFRKEFQKNPLECRWSLVNDYGLRVIRF
jgi:hypothetical protein